MKYRAKTILKCDSEPFNKEPFWSLGFVEPFQEVQNEVFFLNCQKWFKVNLKSQKVPVLNQNGSLSHFRSRFGAVFHFWNHFWFYI